MRWKDIRKAYPGQWLVIEAIESHSEDDQRILDRIAVVETCKDGSHAIEAYRRLRREYPSREFYYVSTERQSLDIRERAWVGIRTAHAINSQG